jgi:hypothetical protein
MEDYDQLRVNLDYTRRFASLLSLPMLDRMYVNDERNILDGPDVFNEIDVTDVSGDNDASNVLDMSNVLNASDVRNGIDILDDDEASHVLDVSGDLDESDIFSVIDDLDAHDIFGITDVLDVNDIIEVADSNNTIDVAKVVDVTNVFDVSKALNVTDVTDIINISDDSFDFSSTSDTTQGKTVCHYIDKEYDANGPPVLLSGPTPCLSRPPKKPPYSKQCKLHDMSHFESLQAHIHEVGPVVVSDNDSTDDLNHNDDDLYDASYEMDPFDIGTPVGTIQAYACMDEKVRMPKDKCLVYIKRLRNYGIK